MEYNSANVSESALHSHNLRKSNMACREVQKNSLSHEALGHDAELAASVLDEVSALGHHHVVELLSFLCDHHIGVPLHSQLQTLERNHSLKFR